MVRLRPEIFFLAAGIALAACTPDDRAVSPFSLPTTDNKPNSGLITPDSRVVPTPFADNRPSYPKTPTAADLKPGIWLSAFNAFINPETRRALNELDSLFPDPIVKNRVAQVLIENDLASKPGSSLEIFNILKKEGRIIGSTLCADSRVICDTIFYASEHGKTVPQFAAIEERSLGAAPRIFDKGINVSILATHCNSAGDISGCGALQALAKLREPGGADWLRTHGIAQDTIDEILRTLQKANPDEQAVIAAKLQAMMNANAHGGERHIAIAVKVGHADQAMEVIDAFDNLGNRVSLDKLPEFAKEYLAVNGSKVGQIDAFLARGQRPLEYVLNTTDLNIQQLMGKGTENAGNTFKITARPQIGNYGRTLNIDEIKKAVAALNYPLTHDWGKIQWILAKSPQELALIRDELYKSDKFWQFLARGNTMVEVVVDTKGKITGGINITQINDLVRQPFSGIEGVKLRGTVTEVILAQRALRDAERLMKNSAKAEEIAGKYGKYLEGLKSAGSIVLKIIKALNPLFNAQSIKEIADGIQTVANMNVVYDRHAFATDGRGRRGGLVNIMTTQDYVSYLKQNLNVEPYMAAGLYDTIYTKEELSGAFWGLVQRWVHDYDQFGGTFENGPKNPKSEFYGVGVDQLFSIMVHDYMDPNAGQIHKKFAKVGKPLIFKPLPVVTAFSPAHTEYSEDGLKKQPFIILNPDTGEFLMTGIPGEMIIPVKSLEPRNGVEVTYYLYYRMDEQGNLRVKCIGYSDPTAKSTLNGVEYIVLEDSTEEDSNRVSVLHILTSAEIFSG